MGKRDRPSKASLREPIALAGTMERIKTRSPIGDLGAKTGMDTRTRRSAMLNRHRHGLSLIVAALLLHAGSASATSVEQREYQIFVEGKEVGQSNMTITRQDDGTTVMKADAAV